MVLLLRYIRSLWAELNFVSILCLLYLYLCLFVYVSMCVCQIIESVRLLSEPRRGLIYHDGYVALFRCCWMHWQPRTKVCVVAVVVVVCLSVRLFVCCCVSFCRWGCDCCLFF